MTKTIIFFSVEAIEVYCFTGLVIRPCTVDQCDVRTWTELPIYGVF